MKVQQLAGLLAVIWAFLMLFLLNLGATSVPVWSTLWAALGTQPLSPEQDIYWQIISEIRLPRLLLASLVGLSLGMAGAAMQGLLRNPLAEPGIMGVSSGAALLAVLVLYFGLVGWHSALLPLSAVLGSGLGLLLVMLIAGRAASVTTLILAGVACSALFSGAIALALSLAPNPFAMQEMSFWLMGSVAHRDLNQVLMVLPFIGLGLLLLWRGGRYLQVLTLGEDTASSMGFDPARQRLGLLTGVALLTGASVAVAGVVGFVGLMVPHMVRPLVKQNPRHLLFISALAGAIFVLLIDALAQWLSPGPELKIGVLMSLLGGPFFLVLLLRRRYV